MNENEILGLLKDALAAYRRFNFVEYVSKLESARDLIGEAGDPPHLLGEWNIIAAMPDWNFIDRLIPALENAWELLQGPSKVIEPGTPLLLDRYEPFGTLLQEAGRSEELIPLVQEAEALWLKLAGGGQGTTAVYLAKLRYYQGRLAEAKDLAWEGYRKAEAGNQVLTQICAAETIGLLTRHGMGSADRAMAFLRKVRSGSVTSDKTCIQSSQIILCGLYLAMGVMTETPDWIKTGDFGMASCPSPPGWYMLEDKISPWLFPSALIMRMQYLCYSGHFVDALNLADMAQNIFKIRFPIMDLYFDFWRASCFENLGDIDRFRTSLASLVNNCVADKLWLIPGESEMYKSEILLLAKEHGTEAVERISSIGQGLLDTMKPLRESYLQATFLKGMTPREYNIAKLIYAGASNAEVAEELHISEQTVKNHLRRVYEKLEIGSRREIAGVLEGAGDEIYAFWTDLKKNK